MAVKIKCNSKNTGKFNKFVLEYFKVSKILGTLKVF